MAIILTLLGNTVIRYTAITILGSLVGLGALAWIRHNAAAPYVAEVSQLRKAAKQKDALIEADTQRKQTDDAELAKEKEKFDAMLKTLTSGSCKPDAAQLERLRKL